MGKKISSEMENNILQLSSIGKTVCEIAQETRISRPTIYAVLKTYRVPMSEKEKREKTGTENLKNLLSLRLLYFCNDYELLTKRLAWEICTSSCKKIFVPKRITSIIKKEKIEKIVQLVNLAGLECDLLFAVA